MLISRQVVEVEMSGSTNSIEGDKVLKKQAQSKYREVILWDVHSKITDEGS